MGTYAIVFVESVNLYKFSELLANEYFCWNGSEGLPLLISNQFSVMVFFCIDHFMHVYWA